jgi:hypothetical protein
MSDAWTFTPSAYNVIPSLSNLRSSIVTEHEVDVRLGPHGVVRQAAAQDSSENGTIALHLLHERFERSAERLLHQRVVTLCRPTSAGGHGRSFAVLM